MEDGGLTRNRGEGHFMLLKYSRAITVVLGIMLIALSCPVYWSRVLLWNFSNVDDYTKFPERVIDNQAPVWNFEQAPDPTRVAAAFESAVENLPAIKAKSLNGLLNRTKTTSFIVIKGDTILYEWYGNGYSRDSIVTSFSVAKSIDSALVGIAIDEGLIKSVNTPITDYIPELRGNGFENVTIKDLLRMSAGIRYKDWNNVRTYYHPDLRSVALSVRIIDPPGEYFLYNNYHPLLIGMILERAAGMPVAEYLEKKIWKPLGMEFQASYSIDSIENGFEKMESGINGRAIDFAKFGHLFLREGDWNGRDIISREWVIESTAPPLPADKPGYYDMGQDKAAFAQRPDLYYKYFWWGYRGAEGDYDYAAVGHLGQLIFISPKNDVVIVRFGKKSGLPGSLDWTDLFRNMASMLN